MGISEHLGHLPSLPLEHRKYLPSAPAIYIAADNEKCLYVGRSVDISVRWADKRHHRFEHLSCFKNVRLYWIESAESALPHVEAAMIALLNPLLNDTNIANFTQIYWEDKTRRLVDRLLLCESESEAKLLTTLHMDEYKRTFWTQERLLNWCVQRGFTAEDVLQEFKKLGAISESWHFDDEGSLVESQPENSKN